MDAETSNSPKRRTVRDFSRRNFVLFYVILLLIPTVYLFWYLSGVSSGSIVPSPDLHLGQPASSGGQMAFYTHILQSAWKATLKMVPYSIGQYLLGLQCDIDQNFVWASGSLLGIAILSLVQIFDVFLNPELDSTGKTVWTVLMLIFSALGVPIPQIIYWFQYMWLEPDRSSSSGTSSSTPVSA